MRMMAFVLFFVATCCMSTPQEGTSHVFDCGVNVVYLIRRLKGMDADLNEISRNLERDPEKGSSIHDLETYLHARGIKTDARMMRFSGFAKKRGTLAILLLHEHGADAAGHFVVARALGNGRVQVIDSLIGASIDEHTTKSREPLPMILIDPPENGSLWMVFAATSVALLGARAFGFISRQKKGIANGHR